MTTNTMSGDRKKVLDAGMNDHIAKPINVRDMFSKIANWITPSEPYRESKCSGLAERNNSRELPELAGIDVSAGLARCQGNQKLYR